jgi:hypothetical protein
MSSAGTYLRNGFRRGKEFDLNSSIVPTTEPLALKRFVVFRPDGSVITVEVTMPPERE